LILDANGSEESFISIFVGAGYGCETWVVGVVGLLAAGDADSLALISGIMSSIFIFPVP